MSEKTEYPRAAETAPELLAVVEKVIETLDAQKQYFKTRDRDDLVKSKEMEKRLRLMASAALLRARGLI